MKKLEEIIKNYATESARDVKIEAMNGFSDRVALIKDARDEIDWVKSLLRDCRPFIEDMIGIASAARSILRDIDDLIGGGQ